MSPSILHWDCRARVFLIRFPSGYHSLLEFAEAS